MPTRELPAGTVTFLFTDVEGATPLLETLGRDGYDQTLALHNELVRDALERNGGIEVDRHGEVSVRVGINTGDAYLGSEGYIGLPVHEAARIAQSADGGQILLSGAAAGLVESELDPTVRLHDLGEWPLAGFDGRRRLYALTTAPHELRLPSRLRAGAAERLLEREAELRAIEALVRGTSPLPLLTIEGRAGMGKTRLVGAARDHAAESGVDVLSARGAELEQDFGYGLVRQLFEPMLATATPDERAELLAGPAAAAERLFSESELVAALRGEEDMSYTMLHGLYWLAANVGARRPTLLAIDDLHWADAASLRWLCYLAPRLEGVPLLVVLASRPAEQGREPTLLTQLLTDPGALALRTGPLHRESVAVLVRELLSGDPDESFVEACCAATGGNPLFLRALLEELAREGTAPKAEHAPFVHAIGPEAVSRAVQLRLARLSPEASALADAIAMLGEDAELEQAGTLASLDRATVHAAASDLARVDLIQIGRPLRFVHPVVRAAVYERIPHPTRAAAHRAAADLVAETGASPERIASHLLLCDPAGDEFVVETLREAAARSLANGVSDVGMTYLKRALDEPPVDRSRVLSELGMAELRLDTPAAVEHLGEAMELESRPVERATGSLAYGRALWFMGEYRKALDVFRDGIAALPDGEPRETRQRLEAEVISSAIWEPELLPVALEYVGRIDVDDLCEGLGGKMLLASLAFVNARGGKDRDVAVDHARRSLEGGVLLHGHPAAFHYAVFVLVMADCFGEALEIYDDALADARRRGDPASAAVAHTFRGFTLLRIGELDEAVDALRQAIELARSVEIEAIYPYATAYLAAALLEAGDLDGAEEALHALPLPAEIPSSGHFFFYRTARAFVRIAGGDRDLGVRELVDLGADVEGLRAGGVAWASWRAGAARALFDSGERGQALDLARRAVEAQRTWGAPRALGMALTMLGVIEGGEEGEAHLVEAVQVLEASPAKLALARALFELGASLRRRNQRKDGREHLRRALDLATTCGANSLAHQAREELLATGARPRTTAVSGAEALTPSETRVARMAAEGLTNREIAQALFVTPKTVEVHLGNAYRKLGISSRMQLADALGSPVA